MCPDAQHLTLNHREKGVVLPIALIMLVIISFAGLMAARNSASHEQFSNNMRTNQVARQTAEAALRYCERVAIDHAENEGAGFSETSKIVTTLLASDSESDIKTGAWNIKSNWEDGAANLIPVTLNLGGTVTDEAKERYAKNTPGCIIQQLADDRYLITSRGLSNDAQLDADGQLESGSEIWLQSVLTPSVPIKSASGGNE